MPRKLTQEQFISRAKATHGLRHNYSKVHYVDDSTKVCIVCSVHGDFWQTPNSHVGKGYGCKQCGRLVSNRKNARSLDSVLKQARKIHGQKYSYENVEKEKYKKLDTKVSIICPVHGEFKQSMKQHIVAKHGCPLCQESKGETCIRVWLEHHHIVFERQKWFDTCRYKRPLPFDFYLPEYDICIEFDGKQHFQEGIGSPIGKGKYQFTFKDWQEISLKDDIKTQWCLANHKHLVRIAYKQINSIDSILNTLLKEHIC